MRGSRPDTTGRRASMREKLKKKGAATNGREMRRCNKILRFSGGGKKEKRERDVWNPSPVQSCYQQVVSWAAISSSSFFSFSSESLFPLLAFLDSLEAHDRIFASEKKSQTYLEATRDQLSRVRFHPRSSEENLRQRRSRDK